jgi:transcriptional regulator with XRE-family HTH domain
MSFYTHKKLVSSIQRRMQLEGLNQKHLALRAGLNETAVRDILKGRSKDPQYSTLRAIADYLGCTVEDLYNDPEIGGYGLADKSRPWPADAGVAAEEVAGAESRILIQEADLPALETPAMLTRGKGGEIWDLPAGALDEKYAGEAEALRCLRVGDDAMAPDFMPGDRVVVHTGDVAPSPAGVFLLWDGVGFILRRCEIVPNSKPLRVILRARNPEYGAHESPLKDVMICGRVLAKWQKV